MSEITIHAEPLTAAAFKPFGQVIEAPDCSGMERNEGTAESFDDLAEIDIGEGSARPCVRIYRARPRQLPVTLDMLERHPLASQAFVPMSGQPFLIVCATQPESGAVRAFLSNGRQGVNYSRGTWHHPLLALNETSDFLIIDRIGPGKNCDLRDLSPSVIVALPS